jgi:hypothetical protein
VLPKRLPLQPDSKAVAAQISADTQTSADTAATKQMPTMEAAAAQICQSQHRHLPMPPTTKAIAAQIAATSAAD